MACSLCHAPSSQNRARSVDGLPSMAIRKPPAPTPTPSRLPSAEAHCLPPFSRLITNLSSPRASCPGGLRTRNSSYPRLRLVLRLCFSFRCCLPARRTITLPEPVTL